MLAHVVFKISCLIQIYYTEVCTIIKSVFQLGYHSDEVPIQYMVPLTDLCLREIFYEAGCTKDGRNYPLKQSNAARALLRNMTRQ